MIWLNSLGASSNSAPPKADRIAVLAIAYHNIGVENEFLKRFEQSVLSYRKGVEVAERYLGSKHAIAITLKNSLAAAKKMAISTQNKSGRGGKAAGATGTAASNKSGKKTGTYNSISKYIVIPLMLQLLFFVCEAASSASGKTTADTRVPGDRNVDSLADAIAVDLGINERK